MIRSFLDSERKNSAQDSGIFASIESSAAQSLAFSRNSLDAERLVGRAETKKPRLAGLSRQFQINRDFSGCNFGGEGGIRTHGTLRYA